MTIEFFPHKIGSSDHTTKVWQLLGSLACETALIETKAVENSISKWTSDEVVNWLSEIGLCELGSLFKTHEVSGEKLAALNNKYLLDELKIGMKGNTFDILIYKL